MAELKDQDEATEAFEDLRDEVADLRAAIEQLPKRLRSARAPDYSPNFGAILQALERIETHPALLVTPERYLAELRSSVEATRREFQGDWQEAQRAIGNVSAFLHRFAGGLRSREDQRKAVIYAAAGGLAVGLLLWPALAGPIARALPASWHVPEKMAAATLNLDRWAAGSRMMASVDPKTWNDLVSASQLWRDNGKVLDACRRSVAKAGTPHACKVVVAPPGAAER